MPTKKFVPPLLRYFLQLFVNAQYLEEVEGDLEELYRERLGRLGKTRATLLYIRDVFQTLRPYGSRYSNLKVSGNSSYGTMLRTNLKLACRSLWKQKTFTTINILGLAIGVASCILLTLFIDDELSFDKQFKDKDRIHRLLLNRKEPGGNSLISVVPHSFAAVIPKDCPEVERSTVLVGPFNDMMIKYYDHKQVKVRVLEQEIYAADSNFFKIFSFKMLKGNRNTMLQQPKSMVLTQSTAVKHFGDTDPLGKIIHMSGDDFIVTGVCEDVPANTHFQFNIIISIHTIERFTLQNFIRTNSYCYLKLKSGADVHRLESKFPKLVDLYTAADFERVNKTSWADHVKAGFGFDYSLVPIDQIYLSPENISDFKPSGNITLIRILIAIDVLIFLIACINFINLATARSSERAKEVGIRKVIGSQRINLIYQFLTESIIVAFVAVIIGVVIVYYCLPAFNSITWKSFQLPLNGSTIAILVAMTLAIGFIAGLYPAFILSGFKPVAVLKGKFIASTKGKWLRSGLVVFQFSVATMLVIGTIVIYKQMKFISEKDLGYNKHNLLLITGDFHMKPDFTRQLVSEIKNLPQVVSVAGSLSMPSEDGIYRQQYMCESMQDIQSFHSMLIGDNFAEVMGFEKVAGELFSENTNDSLSVILNEAAVKAFGLTDPVGKTITYIEQTYGSGEKTNFRVIGVVKDFHYTSLHLHINPLVIQSNEIIFSRMGNVIARLHPGTEKQALERIAATWKQLSPDSPFQFRFMNHIVDNHYKKEKQVEQIITIFSALSIFVSCIGLLGLSAYTASSRTKEIGIRKVVGAGIGDILFLLSKDFTRPVVISFIIACPVSWYLLETWWLRAFAFRIELDIWAFVFVGIGVLLVAWLTVSINSLKAAVRSPIHAINEN